MARLPRASSVRIVHLALGIACAACSTQDASNPGPASELDCQREEYPCTLDDVPADVLARSGSIAVDAYDRIVRGETVPDVAAWVSALSDVVEVRNDEEAFWFRVEGGRPHWVISPDAFPPIPSDPPVLPSAKRKRLTRAAVSTEAKTPKDVVGPFPEEKRALVLAPYLWDFGAWDDGPMVAELLENAKGYDGNVVFKSNPSQTDTNLQTSDLTTWDTYDVVHVSSHGQQVCVNGQCALALLLGFTPMAAAIGAVQTESPLGSNFAAGDDFFRNAYPAGLEDTLVYFSACETTRTGDFAAIFANPSSVFFGWNNSVAPAFAHFSVFEFYVELIDKGRTTIKVLETLAIDELVTDPIINSDGTFGTLQRYAGGDDLRIRELITAYDPSDSARELQPVDLIEIDGIPGDGEVDSMPFDVEIHGIEPGEAGDYTVRMSMNGVEATDSYTLLESDKVEDYVYRLRGEATFGMDFPDGEANDVEFWIDLPEGGETRLKLELTFASARWRISVDGLGTMRGPEVTAPSIVGFELDGSTVWQLALTQVNPTALPTAVLTLVDHNGRTPECTGQTGPFEAELGFIYTTEPEAPVYVSDEVENCMGEVMADITSFSREDGLNISLVGTMCKVEEDPSSQGVVATPQAVSGTIQWPAAGCASMPPAAELLGSFISSEDPTLCQDIYSNSVFGMSIPGGLTQYDALCSVPGATCTDEACAIDEIGNCDYRSDSAQPAFRGTVQHYGVGGDWPPIEDLQVACAQNGGVWSGS